MVSIDSFKLDSYLLLVCLLSLFGPRDQNLRKIREAFLASPMLEHLVRGIGHNLANKGVQNQMTITSQQERGGLSSSVSQGQGAQRGKGGDKGRA